jgi:hypothetical protein
VDISNNIESPATISRNIVNQGNISYNISRKCNISCNIASQGIFHAILQAKVIFQPI